MLKTFSRAIIMAATLVTATAGFATAPAAAEVRIHAITDSAPVLLAQRYDRGCRPRLALRKARDLGLNRAYIVRDNARAVVVDGRRRGRLVTIRFAQERGCPVISVRR